MGERLIANSQQKMDHIKDEMVKAKEEPPRLSNLPQQNQFVISQ
jgi:hypothetical protein